MRVGDTLLDVHEEAEEEYEIRTIHFHQHYNVGPYLNNDIALVVIENGMEFGQYVSPIWLPNPNLFYASNLTVTISGWGRIGYEGVHSEVRQTKQGAAMSLQWADAVPLVSPSICTSPKVTIA